MIARLALLFLFGIIGVADAAVTPNSPVTMQATAPAYVQFVQGSDAAGTWKTLYTGGANGSRCKAIQDSNTDTAATHLLTFRFVHSAANFVMTAITTVSPASAAAPTPQLVTSVAGWPAFNSGVNSSGNPIWPLPRDSDGDDYVAIGNGDTLQATFATNLSTGAIINVYAVCGDF